MLRMSRFEKKLLSPKGRLFYLQKARISDAFLEHLTEVE